MLFTPNDHYPNDVATAQTVAALWSRVGIKTSVEALPWAAYTSRRAKQAFGFALGGWGSQAGESGYALTTVVGTYDPVKKTGATNNARYSNPTVDALRDQALSTLGDAKRKGLVIDSRKDERTLATGIRSAP